MSDLELMRERYLDLALDDFNGRDHSRLAARIVAAAQSGPAADAVLASVITLPSRSRWTALRPWLQAACLVVALGVIGWLIVQRATPPEIPRAEPLPAGVRGFAGSKHHREAEKPVLDQGIFTIETGAPEINAAGHSLRDISGRAVLNIGAAPDREFLTRLIPLFAAESLPLTKKEQAMLRNLKRWSIHGALALCVLSGSVILDGVKLELEAQDDAADEVAAYFASCDTNGDGKITWDEALARERESNRVRNEARNEAERKAYFALYEYVIEREWFLRIDADDNLEITQRELAKDIGGTPALKEGEAPPDDPPLNDKDLRQLAAANVADTWDGLIADADANKDGKLQQQEIRDHFLLDEVKRGGRILPDGTKEDWEDGVDEDISEAFDAADKNKDKKLDKAEYAEFAVIEFKAGDECFLYYSEQADSGRNDRNTSAQRVEPIKLTAGTTLFIKEMTPLKKDKAGNWTRKMEYKLVTIEKFSPLGFRAQSTVVDANKRTVPNGGSGSYHRGWPKGYDHDGYKLDTLKIGGVDYICGYNEYEVPHQQDINGEKVGGKGAKKVQVWHLRGLPGLEVKRIDDGEVVYELLEINIKK
ncbi:MAG: anti-sigma factor [Planctomycetes bacterium]|nr:anti-sigma factor [Planctomycetota bacterium]